MYVVIKMTTGTDFTCLCNMFIRWNMTKKEEKHLCQKRKEKCHGMNKGKRRGKKDKT